MERRMRKTTQGACRQQLQTNTGKILLINKVIYQFLNVLNCITVQEICYNVLV